MLMRSLDQLGDEIAELSVHLDAATVRLLDLIREFDIREGWNNGFRSCAAWLAWRVGLDMGAARERVRVARALEGLPRLAEALACGELSYAKVRALTRVATPETEERLLAVGRAGTAEHVERIVRGWRRVDRQAEALEAKRRHDHRALHVYQDVDGTVVVRGRLEPEAGAALMQALTAARDVQQAKAATLDAVNVSAETRSFAQQQADAWCWSRRPPSIMGSTRALLASATRSSSMSMPTFSPTPKPPASRSSKAAPAFPRKRPSGWRATPAGWRCVTTLMASSWRSALGLGRFRRPCAAHSPIETSVAASRVVTCRSARPITSSTGRGAGLRPCRISSCCAAGITVLFTRRAFRSRDSRMASSSSAGQTAVCCGKFHRLRRHPTTRRQLFGPRTPRPEYPSTRTRPHQDGTGNPLTSAGQLTCYIHWPTRYERVRAKARNLSTHRATSGGVACDREMIASVGPEFFERAAGPVFAVGLFVLFTIESIAPLRDARTGEEAEARRAEAGQVRGAAGLGDEPRGHRAPPDAASLRLASRARPSGSTASAARGSPGVLTTATHSC